MNSDTSNKHRQDFLIDTSLFEKEAILAAAYKFTGKCCIKLDQDTEKYIKVIIEPLVRRHDVELYEVVQEFHRELIDEQLRLDLQKRNGCLRHLIVKHAFSPLENLSDEVKKIVGE